MASGRETSFSSPNPTIIFEAFGLLTDIPRIIAPGAFGPDLTIVRISLWPQPDLAYFLQHNLLL